MDNLYIVNIDDITIEDLEIAKDLDKTDRVLLLTNEDGTMPCRLFSGLSSLKSDIEFLTVPQKDISEISIGFMLGLKCYSVTGNIYILGKNNCYSNLSEIEFPTDKGQIVISYSDSFVSLFAESNAEEPISTDTDSLCAPKKNSKKLPDIEQLETDSDFLTNPNTEKPQVSQEFKDFLSKLSTSSINLTLDCDSIAECIFHTTDDALVTLEFHLNSHFPKKRADSIYKAINPYFSQLRKLLC